MFLVSYVEELNGKNNNTWEDEYDRELDIVKDLIETSEGLPSNPYVSIREFAHKLRGIAEDRTHTIEEDNYNFKEIKEQAIKTFNYITNYQIY